MASEQERLSKLLSSELEVSLFKDNCDQDGVLVESALLAEIERRSSTTKNQIQKHPTSAKPAAVSLADLLSHNDPFSVASSTSNIPPASLITLHNMVDDKPSSYSTSAKQLAEVLAENDPFAVVGAMTAVVRNQFSTSSCVLSGTTLGSCDEACQGCSYCDGVDYINYIRQEENIDEYEQAVEDEDGGDFFENDDGFAVETDDDCVETKDVQQDDTSSSTAFHQAAETSWNPNDVSFWELRQEGKALVDEAVQKKRHMNSSCASCFSALHCQTCEVNMQNPSAKKSASIIKEFAMRTTVMELGNLPCSRSCVFGKDCLRRLSIGQVYELRKRLFGSELEEAPKDKERKEKAIAILSECYDPFKKVFNYRIVRVNGEEYDEVCEGAFLVALGKLGNMKTNQISKSWVDAKRIVMGTKYEESVKFRPSKDFKFQHAGGYIDFITNLFVHQDPTKSFSAMQTIGETSPLAGYGKLIILPYDNLKQFHNEYVVHSFSRGFAAQFIAGYTTFSSAFKQRENVRFLGAKGSFNTCEICNSLNNLLKNTRKKLKKEQIRIVQEFKRLHIAQQSIERKSLEVRKEIALETDDSGQPQQALIFIDGMTELTGNTPKLGATRRSKVDHVIANRVIGVEVYCGPINTVFLYNTDQMVGKGANTMIEVVRQAMSDLALELKKLGLHMPPKISWQFDNCGENKNKTMFAYASALVELGYFEAIDINFLIVGHTHSSIDQYFSVLSKAIKGAEFIGSPISLQALCSRAHKDRARPAVNRQIDVYYNVVEALKPYINKKIKFFQVPHCFSFRRRGNKCVMFYKLFSSHEKWLPVEPDLSTKISTKVSASSSIPDNSEERVLRALAAPSNQISVVEVQPLSCFDGKQAFLNHIGISGERKSNYLINNKQARDKIDAVDSVLPLIAEGELVALHNLEQRTDAEEVEGHVFEHKELMKVDISQQERLLIQNAMKTISSASQKKGYIIWIVDSPDLPPLDSVVPKLIHAGASIHLTAAQQCEFMQLRNVQTLSIAVNTNQVDPVHIEVPLNDDAEEEPLTTEENLYERTKKSFQQRAKDIISVAKRALELINSTRGGISLDYSYFHDKMEFDDRCWEDRCYINPEKVYFENRQSLPHYKLYLESIANEALKVPWKFFSTQHVDEETLKRYESELQNARLAAQAMKVYLTNLQKTGLAVRPGTEVIARDGYNMTTNELEDLQSLVNNERDRSRRAPVVRGGRGGDNSIRGGRGRANGTGRGKQGSSSNTDVQADDIVLPLQSQTNTEIQNLRRGSGNRDKGRRSSRGGNRSRGHGGGGEPVIDGGSSHSSINVSSGPTSNVEPKRKRCAIGDCDGYCEDTTVSVSCCDCTPENRIHRFCSIHIPHISHMGQMGFNENRELSEKGPRIETGSSEELRCSSSVVPVVAVAATSIQDAVLSTSHERASSAIVSQPLCSSISPSVTVATNTFIIEQDTSSATIPTPPTSTAETAAATEDAVMIDTTLTVIAKKILRLFEEGFQHSSKTNISPLMKVLGALNHSCYKEHLGIIATHFNLPFVVVPSVSSLGKAGTREKYLKEVVQAYESRCKGEKDR